MSVLEGRLWIDTGLPGLNASRTAFERKPEARELAT